MDGDTVIQVNVTPSAVVLVGARGLQTADRPIQLDPMITGPRVQTGKKGNPA